MVDATAVPALVEPGRIRLGNGRSRKFQAYVPHRFTNTGAGPLRLMGIHASATIIQTDLE